MNDFLFSVIIPTRNSFRNKKGSLALVLEALKFQANDEIEIIVVENGSNDETHQFLDEFKKNSPKISISIHKYLHAGNRAGARNYGCKKSRGEWLVFLDDDTIPIEKSLFPKIKKLLRKKSFGCGAKRYWTLPTWSFEEIFTNISFEKIHELEKNGFVPCGINRRSGYRDLFEFSFLANFGFVERKAFKSVNGFNEVLFPGWGREDVDLMRRLYLRKSNFVNLHDHISVLHLNHRIFPNELLERESQFAIYEKEEKKSGYVFKANHLFGVFEDDGTDILTPIKTMENVNYE